MTIIKKLQFFQKNHRLIIIFLTVFYCQLSTVILTDQQHVPTMTITREPKREVDYTLDETFWIEENPSGEVERLLREFKQNQELVKSIGTYKSQIIYPVQLRQHKKMGISTRDTGSRQRSDKIRDRSKTGKHYHRTSLLIKAFSHKFRLDLELNTQLIAPNIMQKHYLAGGAEQISKQDIEHCYYHGKVQDYPGATAAFHTCHGISGVIHIGNETFVIHPFYGGDLSKHPHVIFEARSRSNNGCATVDDQHQFTSSMSTWMSKQQQQRHEMSKRDIREVTKYIETALIIDKSMFDKRNGSTRSEVVHDTIQVANIADLYYRTLNTRVSVVYIETWQGIDQAAINHSHRIEQALNTFTDYTARHLFHIAKDTTHLLTGDTFVGGEAGIAVPAAVCTQRSVGISVDVNSYEPHLLAGTMAHMIGHNIGMAHDDGRQQCFCKDWHGCIMARQIVGLDNVQPYKFSNCSLADYIELLRNRSAYCLRNKPNETTAQAAKCGNVHVDEDEECDCGGAERCQTVDPCCDPMTCKLKLESQCASGPCCDRCRLKPRGVVCRNATNECDLPEWCSGTSGACPRDVYRKNGSPCGNRKLEDSKCIHGKCPSLISQCTQIWGFGSVGASTQCFYHGNVKGASDGHCGRDLQTGEYFRCAEKDAQCGLLHCQSGNTQPSIGGLDQYFRTMLTVKKTTPSATSSTSSDRQQINNNNNNNKEEFECKSIVWDSPMTRHDDDDSSSDIPSLSPFGLVLDGTSCGHNLICMNQSCQSLYQFLSNEKCPTNNPSKECSGNGFCTNEQKCICHLGFNGTDCSIVCDININNNQMSNHHQQMSNVNLNFLTTVKPVGPPITPKMNLTKKETPYGENHTKLSTIIMVGVLVMTVMLVFVCFALMAVCYRKTTVSKYERAYKKPIPIKYLNHQQLQHRQQLQQQQQRQHCLEQQLADEQQQQQQEQRHLDDCTKELMRSIQILPSLATTSLDHHHDMSRHDSQRVLFRPANNNHIMTAAVQSSSSVGPSTSSLAYQKRHQNDHDDDIININNSQDDIMQQHPSSGGGGEDELKGILKKNDMMLMMDDYDSILTVDQDGENVKKNLFGNNTDVVERTLKTLNGYHDELLEALRKAALSHGGGGGGDNLRMHGKKSTLSEAQVHKVMIDDDDDDEDEEEDEEEEEDDDLDDDLDLDNNTCQHGGGGGSTRRQNVGTLRIRNLEDLIRQLEHHSRHMSPTSGGSEDMCRTMSSEPEADRQHQHQHQHYALRHQESSSACSESSHHSATSATSRFLSYHGRYRQPVPPPSQQQQQQQQPTLSNPQTPSVVNNNINCQQMSTSTSGGMSGPLLRHAQFLRQSGDLTTLDTDDAIYESADQQQQQQQQKMTATSSSLTTTVIQHHHHNRHAHQQQQQQHDTPDSESDEFIQAQQQQQQWISSVDVTVAPPPVNNCHLLNPPLLQQQQQQQQMVATTVMVAPSSTREYFPSPTSSTSEEPPSIARAPPAPSTHPDHATIHRPKRYPEYKH